MTYRHPTATIGFVGYIQDSFEEVENEQAV